MKKLLHLSMLFITTIVSSQTLLYHFPFNNSLSATTGTGTFTTNNAVYTSDGDNPSGALQVTNTFSAGTDNTVRSTLANLPNLQNARSIAFRVKFDQLPNDPNHVVFQYGTDGTFGAFGYNVNTSGGNISSWGTNSTANITNTALEVGVWYSIVVTYGAGILNYYINGDLRFTSTFFTSTNLLTSGNRFAIGGTLASNFGFGSFAIDHLRIYSGVINQTTINSLNLDQPLPPLAYHFPFNNSLRTADFSQGVTLIKTATSDAISYADSNTSLLINGGGNSAELSASLGLLPVGNASRTVHLRIKINGYPAPMQNFNSSHRIFNYGTASTNQAYGWSQNDLNTTNHFFFGSTDINQTNTINVGTWYNMTFVHDGTNVSIYKDGTLVSTVPRSLNTVGTNFYIGTVLGDTAPNSSYLNATIDDIKIYRIALSASQINELITTGTLSSNNFKTNNLKFSMFPNPATNLLNIDIASDIQSVEIYSLQGQKVLTGSDKQINISGLSAGMYMVRVQDVDGGIATQKLLVE
jgi:hypothetical protein